MLSLKIRYVHTNLVARDWKLLAKFYIDVLGCKPKPPERHIEGEWLDDVTSVLNAHIDGIHLLLPGFVRNGPTLEIFQYSNMPDSDSHKINQPGFGHLAFAVENVQETLDQVIRNGGGRIGKLVSTKIKDAGEIEFVYAFDPEGNIIELQRWS